MPFKLGIKYPEKGKDLAIPEIKQIRSYLTKRYRI